jgi:hypothetical protein
VTRLRKEFAMKEDSKKFKDDIIHEFRVAFVPLIDQMKLLVKEQHEIMQRLD